jgi:hypothetical protein
MRPVGLETITSWQEPELIRQREHLLVFRQRPFRLGLPLRLLVLRRLRRPRRAHRAVVGADIVAAELSPLAEAALAGRPRLPHLRRTPRLLLPAVEGDVRTEPIRLSKKFAKRKRLCILEPFFFRRKVTQH